MEAPDCLAVARHRHHLALVLLLVVVRSGGDTQAACEPTTLVTQVLRFCALDLDVPTVPATRPSSPPSTLASTPPAFSPSTLLVEVCVTGLHLAASSGVTTSPPTSSHRMVS